MLRERALVRVADSALGAREALLVVAELIVASVAQQHQRLFFTLGRRKIGNPAPRRSTWVPFSRASWLFVVNAGLFDGNLFASESVWLSESFIVFRRDFASFKISKYRSCRAHRWWCSVMYIYIYIVMSTRFGGCDWLVCDLAS